MNRARGVNDDYANLINKKSIRGGKKEDSLN